MGVSAVARGSTLCRESALRCTCAWCARPSPPTREFPIGLSHRTCCKQMSCWLPRSNHRARAGRFCCDAWLHPAPRKRAALHVRAARETVSTDERVPPLGSVTALQKAVARATSKQPPKSCWVLLLRCVGRRCAAKARCVARARGARNRLRPRESPPIGPSYRVAKICHAGYLESNHRASAVRYCCGAWLYAVSRARAALYVRAARETVSTHERVSYWALSPRRAGYLEAMTEVDSASSFTPFSLGGGPEENTSRRP